MLNFDGKSSDWNNGDQKSQEEKRRVSMLHIHMKTQLTQYEAAITTYRAAVESSLNSMNESSMNPEHNLFCESYTATRPMDMGIKLEKRQKRI